MDKYVTNSNRIRGTCETLWHVSQQYRIDKCINVRKATRVNNYTVYFTKNNIELT